MLSVKGKYLGKSESKSIFFWKSFNSFSNLFKFSSKFSGKLGHRIVETFSFVLKLKTVTLFVSIEDKKNFSILFIITLTFAFNQLYLFSTSSKFSSFSFSTISKYLLSIAISSGVNLISSGNFSFISFNFLKSSRNLLILVNNFSLFSSAIRSFSFSITACLSFSKLNILSTSTFFSSFKSICTNSPAFNFSIQVLISTFWNPIFGGCFSFNSSCNSILPLENISIYSPKPSTSNW